MENFWTIAYRKILNKRSSGPYVMVRGGKLVKLRDVKDINSIIDKNPYYEVALRLLNKMRNDEVLINNKRWRLILEKSRYVERNTEG